MRYIVLTTKHHDGFALDDTQLSDYSTLKHVAKRDLIRPYVEAIRAAGLKVGFYFSLCDWYHPDYLIEVIQQARFRSDRMLPFLLAHQKASLPTQALGALHRRMHGQVREFFTNYGKIDLLWLDGQWEHTAAEALYLHVAGYPSDGVIRVRAGQTGKARNGAGAVGSRLSSISIAERLNKDCCVCCCRALAWNHTSRSSRSLLCN